MAISQLLGERRYAAIPAGSIEYRERGSGRPLVFVHGVGVNADLWRHVAPPLAEAGFRCVCPDLPWGAHARPLHPGTDLSLPGMARIVDDFLRELGITDAVIVANDTGGAVAQWLVGHHATRVGALVLTSCDAFELYPPTTHRYLMALARARPLMWLLGQSVRFRAIQRLRIAYGWTTTRPMPRDVMRSFTTPIRTIAGVRADLAALLRAADNRHTFEAAEALRSFDKPAVVLWAANDRIFPPDHGRRLAELLPRGEFATIADSRTFVPEDQPAALVEEIRAFLG